MYNTCRIFFINATVLYNILTPFILTTLNESECLESNYQYQSRELVISYRSDLFELPIIKLNRHCYHVLL